MTHTVYYDSHGDPHSTALKHVFYDSVNETLYVRFYNGSIAGYANVPKEVWDDFWTAHSAGQFYAYHIKDHFVGLNGDVELVARPSDFAESVETVEPEATFTVLVDVVGRLKFTVTDKSFFDAYDKVKALVGESLDSGSFDIVTVKKDVKE